MPSPIASRVDDPYRSFEPNDDDASTCQEGPLASSTAGRATRVGSSFDDDSVPTTAPELGVRGPHAEADVGDEGYHAEAFVLRGRDVSGVEVEVFSASVHQGERERGVQVAMARMGLSTDNSHFSARGEVFTAQAHAGFDNADGSSGFGVSMGTALVGGEVTGTLGPVSLMVAASVGATVGASLGVRDSDDDGKTEYCGRVDFGVGAIGVCVEKRW